MAKTKSRGPSTVVKERLSRCRREMKKRRIGAFLVTRPVDYFYLAGFTGEDSAILLLPRAIHVLSDGRFEEVLKRECPWAKSWMRRGTLNQEIAKVCKELKLRSLAVQPDHMTLADHDEIKKLNKSTRLVNAPSIVADMRCNKDAVELAAMRKAIRCAEEAFLAMRKTIRVGQTEQQMAARLEYEMKLRGATGPSFATICAEGPNAALPHAVPGARRVKKGSAILFDWGGRVGNYCSDLTRMVFVGSIPRKIGELYKVVLEAQMRAIAAIRPGERMCDVDAVARDYIKEAGFGDEFNHGLGHGFGLDVHEAPSLSWRSDAKLEAGMLITVEPGIYLPGVGGVRIEDDVLVTPTGRRVLSHLTKKLEDAIIQRHR
ncbi:MAG: aminopeptidase P family protein [Phycisphaerales bacterium]|nr:MAG: aminopeptidase P family protein [Phycisphaerales bacterium]